jgi:hypothetical protein
LNLTKENVNKILLATNNVERAVFQVAVKFENIDVFQGTLNLAKKNLKIEEVNKML